MFDVFVGSDVGAEDRYSSFVEKKHDVVVDDDDVAVVDDAQVGIEKGLLVVPESRY